MKLKGFTLLELLITMMLLVSLSMVAIASYSYFLRKNERQTLIDELKNSVQYAKSQALILNSNVVLTPLDDSLNWANGLRLITKNKKTNKIETLYQWQWHHPRWQLSWSGVHPGNRIIFSNNPAHAMCNGRFILANRDQDERAEIILNRLGRIRES
ncbi:GspH/FimT family pseudopilin [Legionella rowbothamii]|uniref:GspH/FimT family pseudopilin n=1 Tax=Legionella rowbothamii TaxID=96229 RepID=UPI0010568622|nr:GspH/FimT family pseudopilin [Legionella rowbothamii]